jgi:iron complex outermembrane recepter protein
MTHPSPSSKHIATFGLTILAALAAGAASAQSANPQNDNGNSTGLDEVTVTAERFGATVQTTPVAVTAISSEGLQERQITNVLQAATEIPGIVITPSTGSSSSARIVLRGAGQEQGGINFDPAVGIYIDGVYQPRINGAFFDFFDIERLEVLRGPQGTLYGRNTSGGALKIETRNPSLVDWTWSAQAAAGNWEAREAKAYVSGPIIEDKLAFAVSGVLRERDGFLWGTAYGERIGDMDRRAERAKLMWRPTENLDIVFSGYAMQDYSHPGVGVPLQVGPGVVLPEAHPGRDLTVTESFGPLFSRLNNSGASINATYSFTEDFQLNAITGYGNLRTFSSGNTLWITAAAQMTGDGRLNIGASGEGRLRDEFLSQEVNVTYTGEKFKGVFGVFYFDEEGSNRSIANNSSTIDQDRLTEAFAVFGQGTYTVGNGVSLTLGNRWTREEADFTQFYRLLAQAPQREVETFTGTSPKVGVNWQVNEDTLTYATWTRGFKSGGFNPIPPNANTGVPGQVGRPTPYGEERVDSYELGVKFTSPGGRVRMNVAAYHAEYDGLQLPVFFPGTSTSYTSNATGAEIQGVEIEPTVQLFDGFQLYGNASFTHGEYTDSFICSGANTTFRDCQANKLKGLPPEKWVLGVRYAPKIGALPGQLRFTGSWHYNDYYYNNVANEGPLVQTEAIDIYNASIGWYSDDNRWNVLLDGRNLADTHYVLAGLQLAHPTQPSVTGYINEPRQVVLRLGVNF